MAWNSSPPRRHAQASAAGPWTAPSRGAAAFALDAAERGAATLAAGHRLVLALNAAARGPDTADLAPDAAARPALAASRR